MVISDADFRRAHRAAAAIFMAIALGSALLSATVRVAHAQATEPAKPAPAATDSSGGEEAFNNACRTCHSIKPGDNRLGPSLAGIIGKKAGSEAGFASSASLKGANITWDAKNLDAFIANPDAVIPGNNMKPFTGIADAAVRAKIVGYLASAK